MNGDTLTKSFLKCSPIGHVRTKKKTIVSGQDERPAAKRDWEEANVVDWATISILPWRNAPAVSSRCEAASKLSPSSPFLVVPFLFVFCFIFCYLVSVLVPILLKLASSGWPSLNGRRIIIGCFPSTWHDTYSDADWLTHASSPRYVLNVRSAARDSIAFRLRWGFRWRALRVLRPRATLAHCHACLPAYEPNLMLPLMCT